MAGKVIPRGHLHEVPESVRRIIDGLDTVESGTPEDPVVRPAMFVKLSGRTAGLALSERQYQFVSRLCGIDHHEPEIVEIWRSLRTAIKAEQVVEEYAQLLVYWAALAVMRSSEPILTAAHQRDQDLAVMDAVVALRRALQRHQKLRHCYLVRSRTELVLIPQFEDVAPDLVKTQSDLMLTAHPTLANCLDEVIEMMQCRTEAGV
jgi:hypothetical protein